MSKLLAGALDDTIWRQFVPVIDIELIGDVLWPESTKTDYLSFITLKKKKEEKYRIKQYGTEQNESLDLAPRYTAFWTEIWGNLGNSVGTNQVLQKSVI